ncbi:hypothetical protein NPIL_532721 [Nephila pilipes]|uniref:Uncharacterized protein n=1 Tax=Nephila pilipes TaxID=299642 RepID=A0A8X6K2V8_NEPPI|nr:hypothetical protein NPIL_532721 [Nephila pilipes]
MNDSCSTGTFSLRAKRFSQKHFLPARTGQFMSHGKQSQGFEPVQAFFRKIGSGSGSATGRDQMSGERKGSERIDRAPRIDGLAYLLSGSINGPDVIMTGFDRYYRDP